MNPGMTPPELRALRQFVCWKTIVRDELTKPTKPLFNPHTGTLARTHNKEGETYKDRPEDTWGTFQEAITACRRMKMDGIGFVFTESDPYVGIDIDDCVTAGVYSEESRKIIRLLNSYTEKSPSGTGVHIIVRGKLPPGGRRRGSIEMYDRARYFTLTGDLAKSSPVEIFDRQAELEELHNSIFGPAPVFATVRASLSLDDSEILEKARSAKNGAKFVALYDGGCTALHDGDDSIADCALCGMLAFYCGSDEAKIDRLFRGSSLYRPKWERKDYRERTIAYVLAGKTEFYSPNGHSYPRLSSNGATVIRDAAEKTEDADFRPTEAGSADRVLASHASELRHAYNENTWYVWNGNRWLARAEAKALARVERELRALYDDACNEGDKDRRNTIVKYALKTESNRYMRSVLDIMRRRHDIEVQPTDFDASPDLLNCPNGTLNLRTGELTPHRKEDLLSKLAGTSYDAFADCPLWESFIERALPDPEVRSFFQRACGYALTGDVSGQVLFFLHGQGANGKSVAVSTLLAVMGEYGLQAAPDLLLAKSGSRVPTDIAELHGHRMVATIEVDEGRRFAEGLVKQMTGGDRMKGRFMFKDFFEFPPTHKVFMVANHRPAIRGTDYAIWRRIMLVPFDVTIPENERDPDLPTKLKEELSGILRWCVEGCMEWRRQQLNPPAQVKAAVENYRVEQDVVGRFIDDCCEVASGRSVNATRLYNAYKSWCAQSGEQPVTLNDFGRQLTERGHDAMRRGGQVLRLGIDVTGEGMEI